MNRGLQMILAVVLAIPLGVSAKLGALQLSGSNIVAWIALAITGFLIGVAVASLTD